MDGAEHEVPAIVVQAQGEGMPHALVFTGPCGKRSTVRTKRDRYVLNLRRQHAALQESLAAAERFFVVCQVGERHIESIRKAHADALDDLSERFQTKVNEYDRRLEAR